MESRLVQREQRLGVLLDARAFEALVVRAVAVHVHAVRDHLARIKRFHDVVLDAGAAGIERAALHGRLHPKSRPPTGLLLEAAAALVVSVAVHELGLLPLWKRPEALWGLLVRDIPDTFASLQLRRDELTIRPLHKLQAQ